LQEGTESYGGAPDSQIAAATMEDVVAAISRLDGDSRNLLILKLPDCSISIGGGVGGAYVLMMLLGPTRLSITLSILGDPRQNSLI
jgi:hypothetical protein